MSQRRLACKIAFLFLFAASAAAQSDDAKQRVESMKARAARLSAKFTQEGVELPQPKLLETPLLRLSDPTRKELDGTLWLWQSGSRPLAVLCILQIRDQWNYEHVSITDHALEVTGRPGWTWEPAAITRQWTRLEYAVSDNPARRLTQMRSLVREFDASEFHNGQTHPLRLLPRPIHTYTDEDESILAGGLFALSHGTNPEALIQIEARHDPDGQSAWFVSFARLSSADITIKRDNEILWRVSRVEKWDPGSSYFSAHGPDPLN